MRTLSHPTIVSISKSKLQLDPQVILRLMGEQELAYDEHTLNMVEQYVGESLLSCSPEGAFVLKEALPDTDSDSIRIPETGFKTGRIIQKILGQAEYYALFLVTIGPEVEEKARSLISEGHYLEGFIVDLAASSLVDLAAEQLHEQIKMLAKEQGMLSTNRYSPGYCSWDVQEQQKLFELFPGRCCGISLSESSLMHPIKSISGIIGLGSRVRYQDYPCRICSMKDCHFRNEGNQ
jgi:hypothetical protein